MTTEGGHSLRILHVVNHDQRRGAEQVAYALTEAFDGDDLRNEVVALAAGPAESPPLGVPKLDHRRYMSVVRTPRRVRALQKRIKTTRPDVIVAHGGQSCLHAVLATNTVPVVWHRILELPKMGGAQRLLWSMVAKRATAAVAITDRLEVELRDLGHQGTVLRVPNVRPTAPFDDLDHAADRRALCLELGISEQARLIAFAGHLVEQKDPHLAVRVFEHAAEQLPDAVLVVAGSGPLQAAVEARVRASDVSDRVFLLGHRSDVPRILSAADVMLITSRSESMAGVSVEAALAGCPIVTCDYDGASEVVITGRTGTIVHERTPLTMARALVDFLDDGSAIRTARAEAKKHGVQFGLGEHLPAYRRLIKTCALRPTRVLYLMPDLGVGGAEQALAVIAQHRNPQLLDMRVATLRDLRRPEAETILPTLRKLGVPFLPLKVSGRSDRSPLALARAAIRLRRLSRIENLDFIDSCLFEADLAARFALLGSRVRHVVHLVSTPYAPGSDTQTPAHRRWRRRVVQQIDRATSPLSSDYVAITEAVAAAAVRDLAIPRRRLTVVPRGVDLDHFRPLPQPDGSELRVLCIGRLVPQKAHEVAIRGISHAAAAGHAVRLSIYGEGPLRHNLQALVEELDIADIVDIRAPTRDVRRAHEMHHVFLFPSRLEGQGNALLEAMACARPVVASDIPVFREVLGNVGRFFPADEPEGLVTHLAELAALTLKLRQAEGALLRDRVERRYSARNRVRELETFYLHRRRAPL